MRRVLGPALATAAAVAAYALALAALEPGSEPHLAAADLGMASASATAGLCALLAARRERLGRARLSWLLMGTGLLAYAAGDGYWAWSELALGEQPGVPSWADLGYLAMIPLALAGILLRPILRPRDVGRGRLLLDAGIALAALTGACWELVLRPMFAELGTEPLVQAVTLAYPLGDLALGFCLVMLVLREARGRPSTPFLIAGWGAMALADSIYLALVAERAYATGHPIDVLWVAGLALLAVGAAVERPLAAMPALVAPDIGHPWRFAVPCGLMSLAAGIAWAGPLLREGRWPEPGEAAIAAGLALLGARYVLGYRDTALAHRLEEGRRREAQEQALRDPLTGAANRRAFEERLGELSARASAGGSPFGLAFVDVDCFKEYNDAHGHAAGDDLLRELVAILRRESGPESMVARVGGDEFAVLVPSSDEGALAARVSRLRGVLWGHPRVRASVGGAVWRADVREARALLEAADRELYDAKRRKPGRPAVARAFDRAG